MRSPFVGRKEELAAVREGWLNHGAVVVRGAQGIGKTRLAEHLMELEAAAGRRIGRVVCMAGDDAAAVMSRAERALGILSGGLGATRTGFGRGARTGGDHSRSGQWLLVVDDLHHLRADAVRALMARTGHVGPRADTDARRGVEPRDGDGAGGRWLLLTREALPARANGGWSTLELCGLQESAARDLWHRLESSYGPTKQGVCDRALLATSGSPLALCAEYGRALFDHDEWLPAQLAPGAHQVLAALASARVPLTPAGITGLWARVAADTDERVSASDPSGVLADLVARQLLEPLASGAYRIPAPVRQWMLARLSEDERISLMKATCDLLLSTPGDSDANATRSLAGSSQVGVLVDPVGAAPSLSQPVARLREAAYHALASGDPDRAYRIVCDGLRSGVGHGAESELAGILHQLEASADPVRVQEICTLRARVAARHGRVAEALELFLGSDGTFDAVEAALLNYRAGDVSLARRQLHGLVAADAPAVCCRAAAALAEIELYCGGKNLAESLVADAFERHRARVGDSVRAHLHLALAAIEEHAGRIASARASLSRAAGSGMIEPGLAALIEARRAVCLLQEGRTNEAAAAIADAERWALAVDATAIADEIRRVRGLLALHRGRALRATDILSELVARLRQRGDEMGALRAEVDLARAHVLRGSLVQAAELVSACTASAARRKLSALVAEIQLIGAMIDLAEFRSSSARIELDDVIANSAARADVQARAAAQFSLLLARSGSPAQRTDGSAQRALATDSEALVQLADAEVRTALDRSWMDALLCHARGDNDATLERARRVAVRAERAGHRLEMADALSLCARLSFTSGDRQAATAEAMCAVREADKCGLLRAHAYGLLVLAALARDDGDREAALTHARAAGQHATAAGLPIARLVAAEAIESIAGANGTDDAGAIRHAARATMSAAALEAAGKILSDLGLTAIRPFRVVSAGGSQSFVADADPERLRLHSRALVIDGVREQIIRDGETIADLRRRSLLKRLFFLFAAAPGRIFTKEEIVETVWRVDYHPLRHDAALFTNIMRIRRLLGKDGSDLVRVCEDGYRFLPPKDYLYVEAVAE